MLVANRHEFYSDRNTIIPESKSQIMEWKGTFQDESGNIIVSIYEEKTPGKTTAHTDFEILLPDQPIQHEPNYANPAEMIAIGGGGMTDWKDHSGQGALLTASYPNLDMSGWLVSSKSHPTEDPHYRDPHNIIGWVIGLKVKGLTRQQLFQNIRVFTKESHVPLTYSQPPVDAYVPVRKAISDRSYYLLVGGGFQIEWERPGVLATASYPVSVQEKKWNVSAWEVCAKSHGMDARANLTSYAIAISRILAPAPINSKTGLIEKGVIDSVINSKKGTNPSGCPETNAILQKGYVITGGGGIANYSGNGQLLWELRPSIDATEQQIFTAASKAHMVDDDCTVDAYVTGIRWISGID